MNKYEPLSSKSNSFRNYSLPTWVLSDAIAFVMRLSCDNLPCSMPFQIMESLNKIAHNKCFSLGCKQIIKIYTVGLIQSTSYS